MIYVRFPEGWQGSGGGVWWFSSPPGRGASVSGGGSDQEPVFPFSTNSSPCSHGHNTLKTKTLAGTTLLPRHASLITNWNWNIFVGEHKHTRAHWLAWVFDHAYYVVSYMFLTVYIWKCKHTAYAHMISQHWQNITSFGFVKYSQLSRLTP